MNCISWLPFFPRASHCCQPRAWILRMNALKKSNGSRIALTSWPQAIDKHRLSDWWRKRSMPWIVSSILKSLQMWSVYPIISWTSFRKPSAVTSHWVMRLYKATRPCLQPETPNGVFFHPFLFQLCLIYPFIGSYLCIQSNAEPVCASYAYRLISNSQQSAGSASNEHFTFWYSLQLW